VAGDTLEGALLEGLDERQQLGREPALVEP
jgi:hypothetical protein